MSDESTIKEEADGRFIDLNPDMAKYARRREFLNGKGDGRRPGNSVSYAEGWERIFGRKKS